MQQRDRRIYLTDALGALEAIRSIRESVERERLLDDHIVAAAIERHLITLGEALRRAFVLDQSIQSIIKPLHAIVGLRNRLVHGYFAIEWHRIVLIVDDDIDPLIAAVRRLLAE